MEVALTSPLLAAGVLPVQVVLRRLLGTPPSQHAGFESNAAPIVIHPRITTPIVGATSSRINIRVTPSARERQRPVLVLNSLSRPPHTQYSFAMPSLAADTPDLSFEIEDVTAGRYFVRVQIDGAESLLDLDSTVGPTVTVP